MSKPVIGITCDHDRSRDRYELGYGCVDAVSRAGGVAILLPFHAEQGLPDFVDGLIFSGGNDPDPAAWGEAWHPACNPVDPLREAHERRLVREAERRNLPALGICFGMQAMNLVRGGSLIQHLPDAGDYADHSRGGDWGKRHPINVTADSTFAGVVGVEALTVNTSHHQALGNIGDGLRAVGHAPDGVVEAIEDSTRPYWIGVQWHPERMAADDERQMALFRKLVKAAT